MLQPSLFENIPAQTVVKPFKTQLLKWVGNKQRFAHEIAALFPENYNTYFEPFLGSGAVLGTLKPKRGQGSDALKPLIEIWQCLKNDPEQLKQWYSERWEIAHGETKREGYEVIKANFNKNQNGADFLFLCRACYGGVVRFRQADGYMSTPCGVHEPIKPSSFSKRVDIWHDRVAHINFLHCDYEEVFAQAKAGDLIYCDPPYVHSQQILYRGQTFQFERLIQKIEEAKSKGVYVALSIDGSKKSGRVNCNLPIPEHLFEKEVRVNLGKSMLRRFQMEGETLEDEIVYDRLLLTY